jgi:nucleoside-diphosphate-sugar epimerase
MKVHIVTGGCGFVGRNMVRWLLENTEDGILVVDDLSSGVHPDNWLKPKDVKHQKINSRLHFIFMDIRKALRNELSPPGFLKEYFESPAELADVFHFAAVVGGRAMIEGDPIQVATDLSIDSELFRWVTLQKPARVLYPSSSAAYPVSLQEGDTSKGLKEDDINFEMISPPDLTYGWAKLTGEILARITAEKYGISVACVRPFSGYGEDQDFTYPIPSIVKRFVNKENPIEVWGDGNQKRDFVHIDDVIECMIKALNNISDGSAVNIGSGKPISFNEVIEIMSDISKYRPQVKTLLHKPVGVKCRYADTEYCNKSLQWKPKITLREGLTRIYHYLGSQ